MSIYHLDAIFRPKRIAIIGASEKPGSVGRTVLHNVLEAGFEGAVWPVNPRYHELLGRPCFPSVAELPDTPDLAIIATPASGVPEIVRQCGERGIFGLIILSAGFRETGPEGKALEDRVRAEARRFPGLRIVGPNCLGVMAPWSRLNASFASGLPIPGHVAFLSQSGALCTAALDRALEEGLGFSAFVSVGNMIDVDLGDLIDYFSQDPVTRSLVLYAESIPNARKFLSASRSFSATKPVVAYKAGRFASSAKAAASHTGAMAGEDAVVDAAFRRAGIERVYEIGNIFDCAEFLARCRQLRGPRLAIVTNAGGPGVMSVDALLARQGELASLSPETIERLSAALPAFWSHGNPVDVLGDATPERYRDALQIVMDDDRADAILVILTPQAMTDPTAVAEMVGSLAEKAKKPVFASWMGGAQVRSGIERLNASGIATFPTPEEAVETFMHLVSYARNLRSLYETPRNARLPLRLEEIRSDEIFANCRREGRRLLSELEAKQTLEKAGLPIVQTTIARTVEEAVGRAEELGYPVVMKVLSPQLTHKSDVGGVVLNLGSAAAVRDAWESIHHRVAMKRPDAMIEGVSVQSMVRIKHGVELILGAKRDPVFGMVLMVGAGGTAAEVHRDAVLELPPLTERLARRMLESLKVWPLLNGFRGAAPVSIERLTGVLQQFSAFIAACPEVQECDINPLIAGAETICALDARILLTEPSEPQPRNPFEHLAIRPYPAELEKQGQLADGTVVQLRPIRPEDEPRWRALLRSCSPETIRARFHGLFREPTHEMAVRYCFIDYDRELAIVAEEISDGDLPLMGVGRLVLHPDHQSAEFAVLVADSWQGRGLGLLLTERCAEIARSWNVQKLVAETDAGNLRMVSTFRELGWSLRSAPEPGRVVAEWVL